VSDAPILILAALPAEADAVAPGKGESSTIGPFAVRRLTLADRPVVLVTSGIGKVAIASAATYLIARLAPRLLLVTGTGGALTPGMADAHWICGAVQHDYGAARSDGFATYPPSAWPIGPTGDPLLRARPQPPALALPETVIVSGDAFIEDPVLAARLNHSFGAGLVDMETAAAAQVAALHGLPWGAIKAATDEANEGSAADFHANLLAAARRAGEAIERAIALL
jgi:adenosylhomocysteine nucleosidase